MIGAKFHPLMTMPKRIDSSATLTGNTRWLRCSFEVIATKYEPRVQVDG